MIRLVLSWALMVGFLAGCSNFAGFRVVDGVLVRGVATLEPEGGIGGTGSPMAQGAMKGGDETEGGIGGTGIFGTVADFGSIVINGQTVTFDDDVVQSTELILGQELPLSIGSTALVEAHLRNGAWTAERISLFFPIVGPATAVDPAGGSVEVMETLVLIDENTMVVDRRGYVDGKVIDVDDIEPGDRLAISGLWLGGKAYASRIDRLVDDGPSSLSGILRMTEDGPMVSRTRLAEGCCDVLATPNYVNVIGRYRDRRLEVEVLGAGHSLLFGDRIERLLVEAVLMHDPEGGRYYLAGFGIPAEGSSLVGTKEGLHALFFGSYNKLLTMQRIVPLPTDRAARAEVLKSLGDLAAPN